MEPQSSPATIAHKIGLLLNTNARPFQTLMNRLSVQEHFKGNLRSSLGECVEKIDCRSAEDVCRLLYHAILKSNAFAYPSAEKWCHPYLLMCFFSFVGIYAVGLSYFVEQQAGTNEWKPLASIVAGLALYAGCASLSAGVTVFVMDRMNDFYRCQERKVVMGKLYALRKYIYEQVGEQVPLKSDVQKKSFYKRIQKPLGQPKRKDPCCPLLPKNFN